MKLTFMTAVVAGALFVSAIAGVVAAPNLYGTSGLIEVPDDRIYAVGAWSPAYHTVLDINDSDNNLSFFTIGTGILPNLSVSGGIKTNGDSDVVLNGKYRLVAESASRPSITIGVVDALGDLAINDDPGLYIEVGRNLTAAAEEVAGGDSKPLRGFLGVGTGVLQGVFLGLDWTLTPKLSAMVEYLSGDDGLVGDSHFNAGIRFALTNEIRVDAAMVDFDDFSAGISYNVLRF